MPRRFRVRLLACVAAVCFFLQPLAVPIHLVAEHLYSGGHTHAVSLRAEPICDQTTSHVHSHHGGHHHAHHRASHHHSSLGRDAHAHAHSHHGHDHPPSPQPIHDHLEDSPVPVRKAPSVDAVVWVGGPEFSIEVHCAILEAPPAELVVAATPAEPPPSRAPPRTV